MKPRNNRRTEEKSNSSISDITTARLSVYMWERMLYNTDNECREHALYRQRYYDTDVEMY
ncbi:hypothetical protein SDC9_189177 [bioreactor metagenome]|uniref:Uncharacterized protein n=1 Tax=bioreactor metagenome TaxID=1076179 RepID=A0A645I2A3_9ZZZZ